MSKDRNAFEIWNQWVESSGIQEIFPTLTGFTTEETANDLILEWINATEQTDDFEKYLSTLSVEGQNAIEDRLAAGDTTDVREVER